MSLLNKFPVNPVDTFLQNRQKPDFVLPILALFGDKNGPNMAPGGPYYAHF